MSAEVWQFGAVAAVGVIVILLWIFLIYLPRRTGEGERERSTEDKREDSSERDDLS